MKPDFDTEDVEEDDALDFHSFCVFQLAPRFPFGISFRVPFSQNHIRIGTDSFGRLRKRTRLHPENADAHITLAAHLLSEQPLLPVHAEEAAEHLRAALDLMPSDEEIAEDKVQHKAMAHAFLGDALIVLGQRGEARQHWERAVALDPVELPEGFAGLAQENLNKHPP